MDNHNLNQIQTFRLKISIDLRIRDKHNYKLGRFTLSLDQKRQQAHSRLFEKRAMKTINETVQIDYYTNLIH